MNMGFYSYGEKPFLGNYRNVNLFLQKRETQFNLSLNFSPKRDRTLSSIYLKFPIDALGYIHMGYTRLNAGKLTVLPRDYIGLNFFNPEFSFGVFKRNERNGLNTYTLLTSIKRGHQYNNLLITKDDTMNAVIDYVAGYNTHNFQMEAVLSLSRYLSMALYGRKTVRGEKSSLSVNISKYFKNFYTGTRRVNPFLSINSSFSIRMLENLFYVNQANFMDRSGHRSILFNNRLIYNSEKFGVFNLHYRHATSGIPGFAYRKNFQSIMFNLSIEPGNRTYSFTFRRKPLTVKLTRYIQDEDVMSKIYTSLDYGKFQSSIEYFVSSSRQYIVSINTIRFHGINFFENIYFYSHDTTKNVRFTTGLNIFSPLKIPALSTIKGRVYFDKNANGLFDEEDEPLDSIKIILDNEKYTYTDENGNFAFKYVSRGHHSVKLDLGLMPAEVGATEGDAKMVKTGFMDTKYIEFRVSALGEVSGRLFIDNNVNGVFDDHDIPLEGCIVSLNGKRTWTWEEGKYRFSNVPPGSYRVKVEYCPQKLTPLNKNFYDIYVMPKDKIKGLDFPFIQGEEIKVKVKEF